MNDDDLKEWSERIWAAVEYQGSGAALSAMRSFLAEYERDGIEA